MNSKQATEQISHSLRTGKAGFGTQEGRGGLHHGQEASAKERQVESRAEWPWGPLCAADREEGITKRPQDKFKQKNVPQNTCPVSSTLPRS